MRKALVALLVMPLITAGVVLTAESGGGSFPRLSGPYLGQKPPGIAPELFAPGIVSTGMFTRDIAMTPDGQEIYWTAAVGNWSYVTIISSHIAGEVWTEPEVPSFASNPHYRYIEPCISPDGKRFFFSSNMPAGPGAKPGNFDIWVMERQGNAWGPPKNLGAPINTDLGEYFPSVTRDGTLYFTRDSGPEMGDLWRARSVDGRFAAPEKLPKQVNVGSSQFNAFIDPDEGYLIVCVQGRKENLGAVDYLVVFRNADDTWSEAVDLGPTFNGVEIGGYSPFVSRDGKYFFFMSARPVEGLFKDAEPMTYRKLLDLHNRPGSGIAGIYWVDASFLQKLRPAPPKAAETSTR